MKKKRYKNWKEDSAKAHEIFHDTTGIQISLEIASAIYKILKYKHYKSHPNKLKKK